MRKESSHSPGDIRVGTASWADPGFIEKWYPKTVRTQERLSWYADHFNLVEVNSSFYAIPRQTVVARWCEQTPPGFIFNLKLHRLLSRHATKPDSLPPDLRKGIHLIKDKAALTPQLEEAVVTRFLHEIEPLAEQRKLGALLLQLSPSFRPKTNALSELDPLFDMLSGYRVAVELRNHDWVEETKVEETLNYFRRRKISFVSLDAPRAAHFMVMPSADYVTNPSLAYLRCHGRNAEGFIKGRTVAERFDYKYKLDELKEITQRAVKMAEHSAAVHVVYNNNTANYAPVNAEQMREILEEDYPEIPTGPEPPGTQIPELKLGNVSRSRPRIYAGNK
jgi:uncharacterized protein YecE (DUF72 family)